ncbi:hypothetical protein VYU27_007332 [Nannochloropsis oceanica]
MGRSSRSTPFLSPSFLLLQLLFVVSLLLLPLGGESDGITITRDDDDVQEEAGRAGMEEATKEEEGKQQRLEQRQKQRRKKDDKSDLFLYQRSRRQADLIEDGYACFVTGECAACSADEMSEPYCQESKRRAEVTCEREENIHGAKQIKAITIFDACTHTPSDDLTDVLRFQALMAIVGGLALYGARHQKLKHLTLYERRAGVRR